MALSASTVEYHQRCCSPTNFFLSFIPATALRPFHWYINDLYRFRAFGSSLKTCSCLILANETPMPTTANSNNSNATPHLSSCAPPKKTSSPIFSICRTNTKRTTRRWPKRPQETKQQNTETKGRPGRRLSHSRQLLGKYKFSSVQFKFPNDALSRFLCERGAAAATPQGSLN
jgi:hypothetical protein